MSSRESSLGAAIWCSNTAVCFSFGLFGRLEKKNKSWRDVVGVDEGGHWLLFFMKLVVVPLWKPLRFFPCRKCVTIFEVFSSLQFQKMDMKVELLSWRVFISESHDSLYLAGGFKSFLIFYRGNSSILTDIVQKCWNHLPVHHLKWWMLVSNEGKKILVSYAIRWAPMVLINGGTRGPYGIINRSARNAQRRWRTCRGREGNLTQLGVLVIFAWMILF